MPKAVAGAAVTPKKNQKRKVSKFVVTGLVLFAALAALAAIVYYFNTYKGKGNLSQPSPTPTPYQGPIRALPSGKQTYTYNSTNVAGPVPYEVTIDPLTPAVGTRQTIFVKIKHPSPVTKAGVILYTDNKVDKYPLKLIEGTATDGTWKGSWLMPGSYDYNYYLQFDLTSELGHYEHGLKFR